MLKYVQVTTIDLKEFNIHLRKFSKNEDKFKKIADVRDIMDFERKIEMF